MDGESLKKPARPRVWDGAAYRYFPDTAQALKPAEKRIAHLSVLFLAHLRCYAQTIGHKSLHTEQDWAGAHPGGLVERKVSQTRRKLCARRALFGMDEQLGSSPTGRDRIHGVR